MNKRFAVAMSIVRVVTIFEADCLDARPRVTVSLAQIRFSISTKFKLKILSTILDQDHHNIMLYIGNRNYDQEL